MASYHINMSDLSSNPDLSSLSMLHVAAVNGDKSRIEILLKKSDLDDYKCDVNECDKYGRTALVYTIFGDWYDCAELLLRNGATVCREDRDKRTPLHWAAYLGKAKFISLLLRRMEKTNEWNNGDLDGRTPLHYAAVHRNAKCLRLLLKYAPAGTLDVTDREKKTALHWSVYYGNFEQVKLLKEARAKVHLRDAKWNSFLHLAAANTGPDSVKIVRYLLKINRFYSTQKDCEGRTPLHLAVANQNETLVKELCMAPVSALDELDNLSRSALHYAVLRNNVNIVNTLILNGVSLYKEDNAGATPLHYVAKNNSVEVLQRFLSCEKLEDIPDRQGRSALMWAASEGSGNVLDLMLKNPDHFDIHARDHDGLTALHFACISGHLSCVMKLITNSSDVRQPDKLGQTALFKACQQGHVNIADFLMNNELFYLGNFTNSSRGLSVTIVDEQGHEGTAKDKQECDRTFEGESHYASNSGTHFVPKTEGQNILNSNPQKNIGDPKQMESRRNETNLKVNLTSGNIQEKTGTMKTKAPCSRLAINRKECIRNLEDCNGCTPLHFAAHSGHVAVCKWLLDNGVDPEKKDVSGRTALHGAAFNGHITCMALFLSHCPNLKNDRDNDGYCALHRAAINGHLEAVKMLVLEHKAFANYRVKSSNLTPLDLAMAANQQDVTQFLIDHGGLTIAGVEEVASDTIKRYLREWIIRRKGTSLKPLLEKHKMLTRDCSVKNMRINLGTTEEYNSEMHNDEEQVQRTGNTCFENNNTSGQGLIEHPSNGTTSARQFGNTPNITTMTTGSSVKSRDVTTTERDCIASTTEEDYDGTSTTNNCYGIINKDGVSTTTEYSTHNVTVATTPEDFKNPNTEGVSDGGTKKEQLNSVNYQDGTTTGTYQATDGVATPEIYSGTIINQIYDNTNVDQVSDGVNITVNQGSVLDTTVNPCGTIANQEKISTVNGEGTDGTNIDPCRTVVNHEQANTVVSKGGQYCDVNTNMVKESYSTSIGTSVHQDHDSTNVDLAHDSTNINYDCDYLKVNQECNNTKMNPERGGVNLSHDGSTDDQKHSGTTAKQEPAENTTEKDSQRHLNFNSTECYQNQQPLPNDINHPTGMTGEQNSNSIVTVTTTNGVNEERGDRQLENSIFIPGGDFINKQIESEIIESENTVLSYDHMDTEQQEGKGELDYFKLNDDYTNKQIEKQSDISDSFRLTNTCVDKPQILSFSGKTTHANNAELTSTTEPRMVSLSELFFNEQFHDETLLNSCYQGNWDFIDGSFDLDIRDENGFTLLHLAVKQGNDAMCQKLIERGADLGKRDIDGRTSFHHAASNGKVKCVDLLLERNPELLDVLDCYNRTGLHLASANGNVEVVKLLTLKYNAGSSQVPNKFTALDYAILGHHALVVRFLTEHGARPSGVLENSANIIKKSIKRWRRRRLEMATLDAASNDKEKPHDGYEDISKCLDDTTGDSETLSESCMSPENCADIIELPRSLAGTHLEHLPKPPSKENHISPGLVKKYSRAPDHVVAASEKEKIFKLRRDWERIAAVRRKIKAAIIIQQFFRKYLQRRNGGENISISKPDVLNESTGIPTKLSRNTKERKIKTARKKDCFRSRSPKLSLKQSSSKKKDTLKSCFPTLSPTTSAAESFTQSKRINCSDALAFEDNIQYRSSLTTNQMVEQWLHKELMKPEPSRALSSGRQRNRHRRTQSEEVSENFKEEHLWTHSLPEGCKTVSYRPQGTEHIRSQTWQDSRRRMALSADQRHLSRETLIRNVYASPAAISYNFALDTYHPLASRRGCKQPSFPFKTSTRVRPNSMKRGINGWVQTSKSAQFKQSSTDSSLNSR